MAVLREISRDQTRLQRFNKEQRDQLTSRPAGAEERLPQQLTQAYRHLMLLGSNGNGGVQFDQVDLGPARAKDSIPARAIEYLTSTDRLLTETLAPAALLTDRFGVMHAGEEAVEIERLHAAFYRLPRLPRLADADVLRRCLAHGVTSGIFGLASGSAWDAPDSVLRYKEPVNLSEIQFQAGTWLIRASAAQQLLDARGPVAPVASSALGPSEGGVVTGLPCGREATTDGKSAAVGKGPATDPSRVTVQIVDAAADKVRDIVRVAVVPLASTGADVKVSIEVTAARAGGIPRNTLDLIITEGLRQLGVQHTIDAE